MALTTDITPRINLTPAQVLQDDHRMKRLTLAFCDGLLSYADDTTASEIMEEAHKICGGDPDTLSAVLQTRFFADHTPFYRVIANRHGRRLEVPPLLAALLKACPVLTLETQEEIVDAQYWEYDSDLYRALKEKLSDVATHEPYTASMITEDKARPRLTAVTSRNGGAEIEFTIPRFLDRMLVDDSISLRFLALDREWCFVAIKKTPGDDVQIGTHWKFQLSEVQCRANAVPNLDCLRQSFVCVKIHGREGEMFTHNYQNRSRRGGYCGGPSWSKFEEHDGKAFVDMPIRDKDLSQFYCNPFTSEGRRDLRGSISFTNL